MALLFERFKSCGVEVGALDKVAFDRSLFVNAPGQFRNFRGLTTGGRRSFYRPSLQGEWVATMDCLSSRMPLCELELDGELN
jgi:hypothetical protein